MACKRTLEAYFCVPRVTKENHDNLMADTPSQQETIQIPVLSGDTVNPISEIQPKPVLVHVTPTKKKQLKQTCLFGATPTKNLKNTADTKPKPLGPTNSNLTKRTQNKAQPQPKRKKEELKQLRPPPPPQQLQPEIQIQSTVELSPKVRTVEI